MSKVIDGLKAARDEGVTSLQAVYALDEAILHIERLEGLLRVCQPLGCPPRPEPARRTAARRERRRPGGTMTWTEEQLDAWDGHTDDVREDMRDRGYPCPTEADRLRVRVAKMRLVLTNALSYIEDSIVAHPCDRDAMQGEIDAALEES